MKAKKPRTGAAICDPFAHPRLDSMPPLQFFPSFSADLPRPAGDGNLVAQTEKQRQQSLHQGKRESGSAPTVALAAVARLPRLCETLSIPSLPFLPSYYPDARSR